jgi:CBS domain-containing protein
MHEFLEDTVQHNMAAQTTTVAPELTVGDLLRLFAVDQRDAYPVVSNGKLVGIVSKSDALRAFASDEASPRYDDVMGTTVDEVMTRHVMTVEPDTKLRQALQLMGAYRFESLPVVDDENHVQGMIAREDMVRVLTQRERCDALPLTAPALGYCAIA